MRTYSTLIVSAAVALLLPLSGCQPETPKPEATKSESAPAASTNNTPNLKPHVEAKYLKIWAYDDAPDPDRKRNLRVIGVNQNLSLGTSELWIGFSDHSPFSAKNSQIDITDSNGSNLQVLTDIFAYDSGSHSFVAKQDQILSSLVGFAPGDYYISVNLVSEDHEIAEAYSFRIFIK